MIEIKNIIIKILGYITELLDKENIETIFVGIVGILAYAIKRHIDFYIRKKEKKDELYQKAWNEIYTKVSDCRKKIKAIRFFEFPTDDPYPKTNKEFEENKETYIKLAKSLTELEETIDKHLSSMSKNEKKLLGKLHLNSCQIRNLYMDNFCINSSLIKKDIKIAFRIINLQNNFEEYYCDFTESKK